MSGFDIAVFIVGILSSALVLVSYVFSNQKVLRIVNLVASIIFVIYGLGMLCGGDFSWTHYTAIPIVVLNALCADVHVYYLFFKKKSEDCQSKIEDVADFVNNSQPDEMKEISTSSEKVANDSQDSEN